MKPYDAKDIDDCCKLRRDNTDAGDFWLMTDGYEVSIHEQVVGEHSKQAISVPRAEFNRASISYCFQDYVQAHSERRAPCSFCVWINRQIGD